MQREAIATRILRHTTERRHPIISTAIVPRTATAPGTSNIRSLATEATASGAGTEATIKDDDDNGHILLIYRLCLCVGCLTL